MSRGNAQVTSGGTLSHCVSVGNPGGGCRATNGAMVSGDTPPRDRPESLGEEKVVWAQHW